MSRPSRRKRQQRQQFLDEAERAAFERAEHPCSTVDAVEQGGRAAGAVELRAGPKRKRVVFERPPIAWLEAHDIARPRVEERIERWWRTDAFLPDRERRYLAGMKAFWPEPWPDKAFIAAVLYDSPDERAAQSSKAVRFTPTAWDIDDYEGSHPNHPWLWLKTLAAEDLILIRKVVRLGQAYVAWRWKNSKQYVSRCYGGAIDRAWHAAILEARAQDRANDERQPRQGAAGRAIERRAAELPPAAHAEAAPARG